MLQCVLHNLLGNKNGRTQLNVFVYTKDKKPMENKQEMGKM